MNRILSRQPNKEDDWSNVVSVIVVYPAMGLDMPEREMLAWYHGRLHSNPDHCIVEDPKGNIHVVSRKIVWHPK